MMMSSCAGDEPALLHPPFPAPPPERNFIPHGEEDQTPIVSTCNHSLGNNFGVVSMSVRQWLPVFLISFVTYIKLSVIAEIFFLAFGLSL